jgi:hypothetical protein
VADFGHATGPVVVEFPDEFDFGNACDVAMHAGGHRCGGPSVVVADLTTGRPG